MTCDLLRARVRKNFLLRFCRKSAIFCHETKPYSHSAHAKWWRFMTKGNTHGRNKSKAEKARRTNNEH
ncbi:hypothetical protein VPHPG9A1_0045 [Vibrio phage PG9A-1]